MEFITPLLPDAAASLGLALVVSSNTPLVLLNSELVVVAASSSFCTQFGLIPASVTHHSLFDLGEGEWDIPQLRSLLGATASGAAAIDGYECRLKRANLPIAYLVVHAHRLELLGESDVYIVLTLADVTQLRRAEKAKSDLARDNQSLLHELQHRVANSLQIIASILMQSARRVQSDESSVHIQDAHHRVMSIATLQRMLAAGGDSEVSLRTYLSDLCASISASMIANARLLRLTVTVDDSRVSGDQSVSIGLIVTELVINALKHGYARQSPEGTIAVTFKSDGGDEGAGDEGGDGGGEVGGGGWILSVADDGVGMPDPSLHVKPGLGTGIVEALAAQLEAEILVSAGDPGTVITITHTATDQNGDSISAKLV